MAVFKKGPPCASCGVYERVSGEKYCKACRRAILGKLMGERYLTHSPKLGGTQFRPWDKMEDQDETKRGVDR